MNHILINNIPSAQESVKLVTFTCLYPNVRDCSHSKSPSWPVLFLDMAKKLLSSSPPYLKQRRVEKTGRGTKAFERIKREKKSTVPLTRTI